MIRNIVNRTAEVAMRSGAVTLMLFLALQAPASLSQERPSRDIVFLPAAEVIPLSRTQALAAHLGQCLKFRVHSNDGRDTVGGAMLFLETGVAIAVALSPPAALFVEPSRSGRVFATLGNENGMIGIELVMFGRPDRVRGGSSSGQILAMEGSSTLGEHGSLEFARELLGVTNPRVLRTGSAQSTMAALRDGRATLGVVIRRPNEIGMVDPTGLDIVGTKRLPAVAIARTTVGGADGGALIEECFFSFRFSVEDSLALGGADRFVALDPQVGLDFARAVVRRSGGRIDRWNYRAISLSWR